MEDGIHWKVLLFKKQRQNRKNYKRNFLIWLRMKDHQEWICLNKNLAKLTLKNPLFIKLRVHSKKKNKGEEILCLVLERLIMMDLS